VKIHEYQAKEIFRKYGVPTPKGIVCTTADQVETAFQTLGTKVAVVKAQVHAGGRGKGGGVKLVKSREEAKDIGRQILGMHLKTHQTGPEGVLVRKVLVEEGLDIKRELYVGILLDRAQERLVFMASTEGGMDIEEVAAKTPEKILKEWAHPTIGFTPFQARRLAYALGLEGDSAKKFAKVAMQLLDSYLGSDASLAEINPLIVTAAGDVLALDGKIVLDDNGLFRHPDLANYRDTEEEDPLEVQASAWGLNYIRLDGSIACMVNGAGLAMATMDIIKYSGGSPANFLDVGGGAKADQIAAAFKIILSDKHVKAIFINIFGGILRCDRLAEGVVAAAKETNLALPLVIRMEGTNVELGRKILAESGLKMTVASDMADGAKKAVAAAA
jgi:succinyl-CoA synthetase beta subunit